MSGSTRARRYCAGAVLLAAALLSGGAHAAGLSVTPVGVEFGANENVRGLWLSNTGNAALRAQVRVFVWTQPLGEDALAPSTDLVASPPMLAIEPGDRQFVRIVRRSDAGTAERSYRLLIDELPDPAKTAEPGLHFVMRHSVPVFVAPRTAAADSAATALVWRLDSEASGRLRLTTRNPGATRAQITDLELLDAQGRTLLDRRGLVGYVLPGASRVWPLELPPGIASGAVAVRARIDGRSHQQALIADSGAGSP